MTDEVWLPIYGVDGDYSVSDDGNVRNNATGRLLKHGTAGAGYAVVTLRAGGSEVKRYVHRLVVAAFVGPLSGGLEVNHRNGIKRDNRIENLERCTRGANQQHGANVLGTIRPPVMRKRGADNPNARLTQEIADAIRAHHAEGDRSYNETAQAFGVSFSTVYAIVHGARW